MNFFEKCPTLQYDELSKETYNKIEEFYTDTYMKSSFCRIIIDVVCSMDKTLITLIAGILTGLSVNLATNFIYLDGSVTEAELIFRFLQFIFACSSNVYVIRFTAKVVYIHECGEKYFSSELFSKKLLETARKNLMFSACIDNIKCLERFILRGGICIIITWLTLLFRISCINWINEVIFYLAVWMSSIKKCAGGV